MTSRNLRSNERIKNDVKGYEHHEKQGKGACECDKKVSRLLEKWYYCLLPLCLLNVEKHFVTSRNMRSKENKRILQCLNVRAYGEEGKLVQACTSDDDSIQMKLHFSLWTYFEMLV